MSELEYWKESLAKMDIRTRGRLMRKSGKQMLTPNDDLVLSALENLARLYLALETRMGNLPVVAYRRKVRLHGVLDLTRAAYNLMQEMGEEESTDWARALQGENGRLKRSR